MGFIRDILNPLGPQYGASARGADAAAATSESMDDMLALAMQPDELARQHIAQQIYDRRQRQASRAAIGRAFKYFVVLLLGAFCVVVWQLGDPNSSLSSAANAFIDAPLPTAPRDALAPVRAVRAPCVNATAATVCDTSANPQ